MLTRMNPAHFYAKMEYIFVFNSRTCVVIIIIRVFKFAGLLWYRENGKNLRQNLDPGKLPGSLRVVISIFLYVFNYFCNCKYNQ